MKRKFKIEKDMVDQLDEYSYEEKVKYAAILKILQEDGLTEEMIQKWGRWYKGKHGLLITLSSEYPTFEYDLEKEIMKQRVALQMTKLQTVTGLSLEDFAKEVDLKASNLSRLQSGDHNPTILTLLDLAYRCGYDVEVKVKKKKLPK